MDHKLGYGDHVLYSLIPGKRLFQLAYSYLGRGRVYGGDGIKPQDLKLIGIFFLGSQGLFLGIMAYHFFMFEVLFFMIGYMILSFTIFQLILETALEEPKTIEWFTLYDYLAFYEVET